MNIWDLFLQCVAALLLLDWLAFQPLFAVFFFSKQIERGQRPATSAVVAFKVAWLAAILGLGLGPPSVRLASAAILWIIFRHFFIATRWQTVRRGGGAPGFMAHWTMLVVFFIEAARAIDGSGCLPSLLLTFARIDFAFIVICAGLYKALAGFLHADGMEYGRANPFWGYHWAFYKRVNPRGIYVRLMNILSAAVEFVAGILMLLPWPAVQLAGAVGISLSFLYVACEIRLGRLAFLMALLPAIFLPYAMLAVAVSPSGFPLWQAPQAVLTILGGLVWFYIAALPVVKVVQYVNFFGRVSLPQPLQRLISWYANWVPIIIWRVFTPDVINFFVRIQGEDAATKRWLVITSEETTYSYSNWSRPWLKLRFLHVTESIAIVSVFTTLKYFPSKRSLFEQKLAAYARFLNASLRSPCSAFRFDYVTIQKGPAHFEYVPVVTYFVNADNGKVMEEKGCAEFDPTAPAPLSPVRESIAPGSYL